MRIGQFMTRNRFKTIGMCQTVESNKMLVDTFGKFTDKILTRIPIWVKTQTALRNRTVKARIK